MILRRRPEVKQRIISDDFSRVKSLRPKKILQSLGPLGIPCAPMMDWTIATSRNESSLGPAHWRQRTNRRKNACTTLTNSNDVAIDTVQLLELDVLTALHGDEGPVPLRDLCEGWAGMVSERMERRDAVQDN